ncbi:MAG: sugar ABC transporter permease, partial [Elusimicrobia bacterium]|nr:sugar ABC transporter permease [Elusimicrobiota bacterium]
VVLSTFGAFSLFIEPYVMTGGGPLNKTMSVVLYMYKHAFLFQHMGYAATIGFALALVILVVVLLQKKYLGEETEY